MIDDKYKAAMSMTAIVAASIAASAGVDGWGWFLAVAFFVWI